MVFTTFTFMLFFAITFFVFYSIPARWQWKWLLIASIYFYMSASPVYVLFLFFTMLVTYVGANQIQAATDLKKRKWLLIITLVLTIGLVILLKYSLFLLANVEALVGIFGVSFQTPVLKILLPIGLSFYVFQSAGYCIDVYWETCKAEKNFAKHALFVSYFPQILQGPIGSYMDMSKSLYSEKTFDYERVVHGVLRATLGFYKKLVIADNIAAIVNPVFQLQTASSPEMILTALVLYAFELYADFSGYMDIAIGCSEMLGIRLAENFDTPYLSGSITEFWRRWHSTLGVWFKNYIFYPVLRTNLCNRLRKKYKKNKYLKNTLPSVVALATVWLLIGLWHGADWCYVLYGIYHGSFIILAVVMAPLYSKLYQKFPKLQENLCMKIFRILRTFAIVSFGYILFAPGSFANSVVLIQNLFLRRTVPGATLEVTAKIIVVIGTLILFDLTTVKWDAFKIERKIPGVLRFVLYLGVIMIIISFMQTAPSEFLYFQF